MSRGYLIHAYNNLEIDYGTMAMCSALLIKKNLQVNDVALVTSQDTLRWISSQHGDELVNMAFDKIIVVDKDHMARERTFHDTRYSSKVQPYYNTNRASSLDLSPFDETILIDADYLVLDPSLDQVWGSTEDLLVNRSIVDLRHNQSPHGFDKRFNDMSIPLYWATVVYFKKTPEVKVLFDLMSYIKDNYDYYQKLYQFTPSGYVRNDYTMSIALHLMNGQIESEAVKPLPMPSIMVATEFDDMVGFVDGNAFFVSEIEQGDFYLHKVMSNIHVMNKWSVTRMAKRIISYATS